jgi:hypothetical protein
MARFGSTLGWFVLVVAVSVIAQAPATPKEPEGCTEQDYAIYAAALNDLVGKENPDRVVLLDQTSIGYPPGMAATTQFGGKAQPLLKDFRQEARDDFHARNKTRVKIEGGKIKTAFALVLLSDESAAKLVEGPGGWSGFHQTYPKSGISLVSRPGVNADHTKALLYVGTSCDSLCGGGSLVFLGRDGSEWKVLNKVTIWVS